MGGDGLFFELGELGEEVLSVLGDLWERSLDELLDPLPHLVDVRLRLLVAPGLDLLGVPL